MSAPLISDAQQEALQEITNIGMGQAGASIAKVLGGFVILSVPGIATLDAAEIPGALARLAGNDTVSAVRQAFRSELHGEAVVLFDQPSAAGLAQIMGYDQLLDGAAERELLLDIGNILVGACLGGIAELLAVDVAFSPPSLLADQVPAARVLDAGALAPRCALWVDVRFKLESASFTCHLVILLPEGQIAALAAALDRFLASL